MASLISIINELQVQLQGTSLVQESLELPQIAVVGAQGVGKSSVLEAIIGIFFTFGCNFIKFMRAFSFRTFIFTSWKRHCDKNSNCASIGKLSRSDTRFSSFLSGFFGHSNIVNHLYYAKKRKKKNKEENSKERRRRKSGSKKKIIKTLNPFIMMHHLYNKGRQYAEFLRPFQRSKVPMSEIEGLMRNATGLKEF